VLDGDLILFGRGDPTLNARLHGGRLADALAPLVAAVTNAGIRRIRGDVVADDSFFVGPSLGSGWSWDDSQYSYGAEISALTFNDNVFQVRVTPGERVGNPCDLRLSPPWRGLVLSNRTETAPDSARRTVAFYRPPGHNVVYASGQMPLGTNVYQEDVTVDRPAAVFLAWFMEGLQRAGVKWSGKSRVVGALERPEPLDTSGLVEIGRMESPPLSDIAREIQKPSQNLYTDLLLAHLGEKLGRTATNRAATSEDLGIAQLNRFLRELGVRRGQVFFEEGSGLSRNNLTTPEATVQLLRHMDRHPAREAFVQALPVAGVDGTLRNRMKDTPAAGNARAKTGTLRWANALSGYLTTAAGERLAFSIMLNRYANDDPRRSGRAEIDALVVMLASLAARSDAAP
jgi:D-alanyl-D-alanine carboxypeptidase/D-alanyl-D-alanine-endopeptidase (penicillin-binding protein 4)